MATTYCGSCGAAIEAGKKFCPSCGAAQQSNTEQPTSAVQPALVNQQTYQTPSQPGYGQQPGYNQQPNGYQNYSQPGYAPAPAPKKKHRKAPFIIIGSVAAFFVLVIVIAAVALIAGSNMDYYKLDNDQIPTIKFVVGKRAMGLAETSRSGGVLTKSFQYKDVEDARADMTEYLTELINEQGFLVTASFNIDNAAAEGQLAKNSVDKGQIIILNFSYYEGGYTFVFTKGEGSITN